MSSSSTARWTMHHQFDAEERVAHLAPGRHCVTDGGDAHAAHSVPTAGIPVGEHYRSARRVRQAGRVMLVPAGWVVTLTVAGSLDGPARRARCGRSRKECLHHGRVDVV